MIPVVCRSPHKPEENKYGDCMRCAVASILELDAEDVPHFLADGADGELAFDRLREFLATRKLVPIYFGFPGAIGFDAVMEGNAKLNPGVHCILFCSRGEDHVIVVKDGEVVHDPAWGGKMRHYPPTSDDIYAFLYFAAML